MIKRKNILYKAVRLSNAFPPEIVKFLGWVFFLLAILLFLIFLDPKIVGLSGQQALGLFMMSFDMAILCAIYMSFLDALRGGFMMKHSLVNELTTGKEIKDINLTDYLGFRLTRAIIRASDFCKNKKIALNSFVVIYFFWKDERGKLIFEKMGLEKGVFKKKLKDQVIESQNKNIEDEKDFNFILEKAALLGVINFHNHIEIKDFLVVVAEEDFRFREILSQNDMGVDDVDHVASWENFYEYEFWKRKKFWLLENLTMKEGIGRHWAAGYSVNLDRYSTDITKIIKKQNVSVHLMAHDKEINAIERILSKGGEHNVLLVGSPGSGRTTIAYAFAKKISEGKSFGYLNYKRFLELDMQLVLAGLDTPGQILERLEIIFSEAAKAGNIILLIDEIHNYLGSDKGPGSIDISSVLLPFLPLDDFQVFGITSYDGWYKYIDKNPSIKNLFVKVEVREADNLETIMILEDMLPGLEDKYDISINYRAIRDVVKLSGQYIQDAPFPEKAIDILTEAIIYAKKKGEKKVLPEHINIIISERTEVPVGAIKENEKQKLLNLENKIHQRVIDQEEAIKLISEAMRRARAGVKSKGKPIGSFLFLGPTGVGKTETSKALAESYFGSEEKMIRFDMSEYQQISSISRLIGSSEMGEPGLLTKAISNNPFSLLLLDEIEKSHPNILNLFLQVLDEGWLTDVFGKRVSFGEAIIIGTSNAGAEMIREKVKQGLPLESFKEDLIDYLLKQGIFSPEFLNRFDAVVVFKPLTPEHLIQIAKLMLDGLAKRLYDGMGLRFIFNEDIVKEVAKLGYKPEFGARPMKRIIQDKIENVIAKRILESNFKRGDFIEIKLEEIK